MGVSRDRRFLVAVFDSSGSEQEGCGMLAVGERQNPEDSLRLFPDVTLARAREIAQELDADFEFA
jgi:hypothetical protein